MVWYSDTIKWKSKTALTRKKNEIKKAIEIDEDMYNELFFEYAYILFENPCKHHLSPLFWKWYDHIFYKINYDAISIIKQNTDFKEYTKEQKLTGYKKHLELYKINIPKELAFEIDIELNHEGGKSWYSMKKYFLNKNETENPCLNSV